MITKTTRAIVGAVAAMSLMAIAVMAMQTGAREPRQEFKGPVKEFIPAGTTKYRRGGEALHPPFSEGIFESFMP